MLEYILTLFILGCGYYTLTYGTSLWKRHNRLGGFGVWVLAALGTIAPIVVLFIKM